MACSRHNIYFELFKISCLSVKGVKPSAININGIKGIINNNVSHASLFIFKKSLISPEDL